MPARARSRRQSLQLPHETLLHRALIELKTDLPIAEFLRTHFADRQYTELREAVRRMVEGYDAADPDRASTFALRDEWIGHGRGRQGRIAGGYGALIKFLVSECRKQGTTIHLSSVVTAIDESHGQTCRTLSGRHDSRSGCRNSYRAAPASCATLRFRMPYTRRSRPVRISDSVMSSKSCCASQGNGGPIVADMILASYHSCSPAQRFPSGGRSIRPNFQC